MMKIGIATVHDSCNLGSYLQALAMQEIIKSHGDKPIIIKTRSELSTLCLFLGYNNAKSVRTIKSALYFMLYVLRHPKKIKTKYIKYKTYQKDWKKFETVMTVKKVNQLNMECLILGSDEIWNMNQPTFQNPLLYGSGIKAEKKIGYAVSVGDMLLEKMQEFPELQCAIKKLDVILPRDNYTKEVLGKVKIHTDKIICDPTIQIDIRKYMKKVEEVKLPKEDYMIVYSYSVDERVKSLIQEFAQEKGVKTVAVSLEQAWCDDYLNCSPLEFGAVLTKAKYVFTSTFHGTIFSALYHTKFISQPARPKVKEVLQVLGLEDHKMSENIDYSSFRNLMEREYSFEPMEEKLALLRKESYKSYEGYVKNVRN